MLFSLGESAHIMYLIRISQVCLLQYMKMRLVEDNILTPEQIEKIISAFVQGRAAQGGDVPTDSEREAILWWFNEIARGAVLMQWVLDGELALNMKENVIAFIDISQDDDSLSPLIMKQLESLDFDSGNEV